MFGEQKVESGLGIRRLSNPLIKLPRTLPNTAKPSPSSRG
jgi:hypothetical protein